MAVCAGTKGAGLTVARARASTIIAGGVLLLAVILPASAQRPSAEPYPVKPIRLILPFPPGGATDTVGRIVGQTFSEFLGQSVITDNRPGAAGRIGYEMAARAPADGYTLVIGGQGLAVLPALFRKLNFDTVKDFAPISLVGQTVNLFVTRPGLPATTLKELVAYAKANPKKLSFGSGGIGTGNHLGGELLKHLGQIELLHVPYKGANQALLAMIGGEVDMVTIGLSSAITHIRSKKVRPMAVLSTQRLSAIPEVPTSREAGFPDFQVNSFHAILAPAGTPRAIIDRLNAGWAASVATADTRERMERAEVEPVHTTPEEFARFQKAEIERWTTILRAAKVSLD